MTPPPTPALHAASRLTPLFEKKPPPAGEEGGPAQTAAAPATTQTRQVAPSAPLLCYLYLSPSANSFKQNKRSVFVQSGYSLMESILLSQQ